MVQIFLILEALLEVHRHQGNELFRLHILKEEKALPNIFGVKKSNREVYNLFF